MATGYGANQKLRISLAGIPVEWVFSSEASFSPATPFYPFLSHAPAEVTIRVHTQPPPAGDAGQVRFHSPNWRYLTHTDQIILQGNIAQASPAQGQFTLRYHPVEHSGDLYLEGLRPAPGGNLELPPQPLDEILAVHLLGNRRGALIHGCGVSLNGTGLLFSGSSGDGKTTLARLWQSDPEAVLLSDERVAVRREGSQMLLYGTAWHGRGRYSHPVKAPLRQLFFLKHAPTNRIRPLTTLQAVEMLLSRSFLPFWDASGMAFSLQFLEELCAGAACYELGFVPDDSAIRFLKAMQP